MADRPNPATSQDLEASPRPAAIDPKHHPEGGRGSKDPTVPTKPLQTTVAKLYGAGMKRSEIARALVDHLVPNGKDRPLEQRLSQARTKLKNWEHSQSFRDMVYQFAVVKVDMATPDIFQALVKKAKKGNVSATRLLLEVSGRHNPKGEQAPPNIIVAINGMPRPANGKIQMQPGDVDVDPDDPTMITEVYSDEA